MEGGKKTKGRQKIEMKRIENEDERLITFSKRRSGIYKKASELVILTGCQVAFLVFSPAGKPFSYAHPSFEDVANRFLKRVPAPDDVTHPLVAAHRVLRISGLNEQHNRELRLLEHEKDKGKHIKMKLRGIMDDNDTKYWWDTPTDELTYEELLHGLETYEELLDNTYTIISERTRGGASSSSYLPPPPPPPPMDDPVAPAIQLGFNPFAMAPSANEGVSMDPPAAAAAPATQMGFNNPFAAGTSGANDEDDPDSVYVPQFDPSGGNQYF